MEPERLPLVLPYLFYSTIYCDLRLICGFWRTSFGSYIDCLFRSSFLLRPLYQLRYVYEFGSMKFLAPTPIPIIWSLTSPKPLSEVATEAPARLPPLL